MNDAEKMLVRDVLGWFRKDLGLPPLGLRRGSLRFVEPSADALLEEDPDPGLRLSRSRLARAALYAVVGGALTGLAVYLWAGSLGFWAAFFTGLLCALVLFFPLLLPLVPERTIVVAYGPGMEQALVRALALAYFNRPAYREAAHCLLDVLLLPLLLSCQEGVAYWYCAAYFRAKNREGFDPVRASLRGRLTADLIRLGAWLTGGRLPRWLLLYG